MYLIEKNGRTDFFDFRIVFGKEAKATDFYPIMRRLTNEGLVCKTHELSDGTKFNYNVWVKTPKWDEKTLQTEKPKKVCFISAILSKPLSYKELFNDKLGLPMDVSERAEIYISNKKGEKKHRLGVSRGFAFSIKEYYDDEKEAYIIPASKLQIELTTKPINYTISRRTMADKIGASFVEVKSRGHTPPKIGEIIGRTTTDKGELVKTNLQKLLNDNGVPASLNFCKLVCQ
jgi:hypothetical protein